MDQMTMIAIVVGVALVVLAAVLLTQRRRSDELRARYGPEYDHIVDRFGDKRHAEAELRRRVERVELLNVRALSPQERGVYLTQWRAVQARFVDDPKGAVTDADRLVEEVMKTRGYPVADFDQREADLSVHHPRVVSNYRSARDIARRHRRGEATTEDLRQAMVFYRELFQDLLEDRENARTEREVERKVERAAERAEETADRVRDGRRIDDREVRP
jgi:hypothetical protein